jgi:transcriptional regulator with XRE-family HTH domain
MEVEAKLKQFMDDKNITINEMATVIEKNRNTVSSYLRGKSAIDVNSLLTICDHYEVPISVFIKDDEKKELLKKIDHLEGIIDRLEFYLSHIVYDQIDHKKRDVPLPETIYGYPQIRALKQKYDLIMLGKKLKKEL